MYFRYYQNNNYAGIGPIPIHIQESVQPYLAYRKNHKQNWHGHLLTLFSLAVDQEVNSKLPHSCSTSTVKMTWHVSYKYYCTSNIPISLVIQHNSKHDHNHKTSFWWFKWYLFITPIVSCTNATWPLLLTT